MKDLTIGMSLKDVSLKKGSFDWDDETCDFIDITMLGQKKPSKKDMWLIELELEDLNILSNCDYDTARIIQILCDRITELNATIDRG